MRRLRVERDRRAAARVDEIDAAVFRNPLADEVLQRVQSLVRILAGHQPTRDLGRRLRRDDGLGAHPLVAARHAVEFAGGPRPDLFEHAEFLLARGHAEADVAEECGRVEPQSSPLLELLGAWLGYAVVEARHADSSVVVVQIGQDVRQGPDRVHRRAAVVAGVQIPAGPRDDHFRRRQPAQHQCDAGCILVPLRGITNEREISRHLLAVLGEEARQARRTALLLAFEQDGHGDRQLAGDLLPGPGGLEEGHELAFVVLGPPCENDLAVAALGGDARIERRRFPEIERVRRLHVVMAVEEDVRRALGDAAPVVPDDHGVTGRRPHRCLEANVLERFGAPLSGGCTRFLVGRVGRDARDAQELEQALGRVSLGTVERLENGRQVIGHLAGIAFLVADGGARVRNEAVLCQKESANGGSLSRGLRASASRSMSSGRSASASGSRRSDA